MTEPAVLVIEDEAPMRALLRETLASAGYRVVLAATGAEGERLARSHAPELVLVDLGLPDGDGLDLTARLRTWCTAPIVVLSARGREEDKVRALDLGADDYVTKPFGAQELLARLRVALRHRAKMVDVSPEPALVYGPFRLDPDQRRLTKGGVEVKLTPHEYRLFAVLLRNPERVLTHTKLLAEVWGPGSSSRTQYLRVYMASLRQKLEDDAAQPRFLVTEAGVGYRLTGG